jgi:hypothetical protein
MGLCGIYVVAFYYIVFQTFVFAYMDVVSLSGFSINVRRHVSSLSNKIKIECIFSFPAYLAKNTLILGGAYIG